MRSKILLVTALAVGCASAPVRAQTEADDLPLERDDRFAKLREAAQEMIGGLQQLSDWDTHYAHISDAVESVYERNEWTSEPDLFSLEMMREVSRIPPWQVQERFDAAIGMVGDRYLLDELQEAKLRQMALQENLKLFSKHSDRIMDYALDVVATRAAGEPFTPEQVARWAELARPVFMDSRRSMNQSAQKFMQELDPEQRELVQADLHAANARLDVVAEMGERWVHGEWDAADWGLENDPIQMSGHARGPDAAPQTGGADGPAASGRPRTAPRAGGDSPDQRNRPPAARGPHGNPSDAVAPGPGQDESQPGPTREPPPPGKGEPDDEWARYVRAFCAKYRLNDEQEQRAWLFYKDSKTRGAAMTRRFERVTGELKNAKDERSAARFKQASEQHDSDLERIFERLKDRLEQLPTRAQRRAAAEAQPAAKPKGATSKP